MNAQNVTKYMYSNSAFMKVLKFSIDSRLISIDSDCQISMKIIKFVKRKRKYSNDRALYRKKKKERNACATGFNLKQLVLKRKC
jgi:hypothetical protein